MKLCINCIHYVEVYQGVSTIIGCDRKKLVDLTDGRPVYKRASGERSSPDEDRCGPEGKFFAEKQT